MRIGEFDNKTSEYRIHDPRTPLPWINYISNSSGYCGIVSQTGGGFSFFGDPRTRRLTKYRYNNVPMDRPGRYLYLRDDDTGEVWSPCWQPVCRELDSFSCSHGLGYSRIESSYKKLQHEVTYFVPTEGSHECWQLRMRNTGDRELNLSLYAYVEFSFWTEAESRNQQWSAHLTRASFSSNTIQFPFIEGHPSFIRTENKDYQPERPGMAYLTWTLPVDDFDTVRDQFIGRYRHEGNPAGLESDRLSNSILSGGVGCGALRRQIKLSPGQEINVCVLLGFDESEANVQRLRKEFSCPQYLSKELAQVVESRKRSISALQGKTPDGTVNELLNVWHPYQCQTTFAWSRYISFYENGEGRGMGTRDSFQDLLAICAFNAPAVEDRLQLILESCQFTSGSCYHQFYPLLKKGELHGFSDDHLWSVLSVHAAIAETGDTSLLARSAVYADAKDLQEPIYDHLCRALDFVDKNKGPHGLPLILNADWNDTLHLWMQAEDPESSFVGFLYVAALKKMADLAKACGKTQDASDFLLRAEKMSDLINQVCWDGEWYLRGFANGPVGTAKDKHARIFLNPQSWAMISGVAKGERADKCMASVVRELDSPFGPKVLAPTFRNYDPRFGLISRYVPGHKENGVFAHAAAWSIIAWALRGDSEKAYETYQKITPAFRNDQAQELKTEPYVYCQTIASDDALYPGEGANSWLTGTASWMYVALTQHLIGLQPALDGLHVNPCLPKAWKSVEVNRDYRGTSYNIEILRDAQGGMSVDGSTWDKDAALPTAKGKQVKVSYRIADSR